MLVVGSILVYRTLFSGTLITLGKKRGDLKHLWTRGEPDRPCPHVQLQQDDDQ